MLSRVERGRACGPPPKPTRLLLATELIEDRFEDTTGRPIPRAGITASTVPVPSGSEELGGVLEVLLSDAAVDGEHAELNVLRYRGVDRVLR